MWKRRCASSPICQALATNDVHRCLMAGSCFQGSGIILMCCFQGSNIIVTCGASTTKRASPSLPDIMQGAKCTAQAAVSASKRALPLGPCALGPSVLVHAHASLPFRSMRTWAFRSGPCAGEPTIQVHAHAGLPFWPMRMRAFRSGPCAHEPTIQVHAHAGLPFWSMRTQAFHSGLCARRPFSDPRACGPPIVCQFCSAFYCKPWFANGRRLNRSQGH